MQGEDRDGWWVLRRREVLAPVFSVLPSELGRSLRGRRSFSGDSGQGSAISWLTACVLGAVSADQDIPVPLR